MQIIQTTKAITSDGKKFDDVAKAELHEASLKVTRLVTAWQDRLGTVEGKHGRRKSTLATVAQWEAAKASGLLDELAAELDAQDAAAAAAKAEADAVAAQEPVAA